MSLKGEYLYIFQQAMEDLIVTQNKIPSVVITGGAKGADALGESWARQHNIPLIVLTPEYTKYGNKAPILRNTDIVKACTHPSGTGTQDAIRKAMKMDKIVVVHQLK